MTEKLIRNTLMKTGKYHDVEFFPIETRGTTLGMADLLYAGGGVGGVIELKILRGKYSFMVPFRAGQRMFLLKHSRGNPRTFVLAYTAPLYFLIGPGPFGFPPQYSNMTDLLDGSVWSGTDLTEGFFKALMDGPG